MQNTTQTEDTNQDRYLDELSPGTDLLQGQYKITKYLNSGGFGITYLATDSLDRKVVIKECFPSSFCDRSHNIVRERSKSDSNDLRAVVQLFVQEARRLAKLDHPNIVGVHQVFEDNETAYMVLDFVEGRDLLDMIEDGDHNLSKDQITRILKDVLGAVQYVHDKDILHRDISPDNILIDADLKPILIDFGSAREEATKKSRVLSAMRVVKDGYSPQEFYVQGSQQSPSSDLYALGATFYHLISGNIPPSSQSRLAAIVSGEKDPFVPLVGRAEGFDVGFLEAIDKSLALLPRDRLQSASQWLDIMEGRRSSSDTVVQIASSKRAAGKNATSTKRSGVKTLMRAAAVAAILLIGGVAALVLSSSPSDDAASTNSSTQTSDAAAALPDGTHVAQAPEVIGAATSKIAES